MSELQNGCNTINSEEVTTYPIIFEQIRVTCIQDALMNINYCTIDMHSVNEVSSPPCALC